MTNHFRLLLSPEAGQSISRILQSLSVAHTWHYHKGQGTVGHIWQGRFKSPVIEEDNHALVVLRYVVDPLNRSLPEKIILFPAGRPATKLGAVKNDTFRKPPGLSPPG